MSETFVDYIVRVEGSRWAVYRRSFDSATTNLQSTLVSTHHSRDEALAAIQRITNDRW